MARFRGCLEEAWTAPAVLPVGYPSSVLFPPELAAAIPRPLPMRTILPKDNKALRNWRRTAATAGASHVRPWGFCPGLLFQGWLSLSSITGRDANTQKMASTRSTRARLRPRRANLARSRKRGDTLLVRVHIKRPTRFFLPPPHHHTRSPRRREQQGDLGLSTRLAPHKRHTFSPPIDSAVLLAHS